MVSLLVTTYLRRYERYFQPLMWTLRSLFPDADLVALVNGHPSQTEQLRYLQAVVPFLADLGVRHQAFLTHQPLARLWNRGLLLAEEETCLLLNDDVEVRPSFREALPALVEQGSFTRLNGSFSHFLLPKAVVRRVGFFDEGFAGMGNEDWDYLLRLALSGEDWLRNERCPGLTNFVAPATDPTWGDRSGVVNGKYAATNLAYFTAKWQTSPELVEGCPDLSAYFPFRGARLHDGYPWGTVYDLALL